MRRNIVVTGGAKGLGLRITTVHLQLGDRVFVPTLFISEELKALAKAYPGALSYSVCNLENTDDVKKAFAEIRSAVDRIDILYNNAGLFYLSERVHVTQTSMDLAMKMYNVNALGILRVFSQAEPLLQQGSVALNVTSEAGSITDCYRDSEYGYAMSKAAANMACKTFANSVKEKGVRVICVHPGWMKTDMGGDDAKQSERAITPETSAQALTALAMNPGLIAGDVMFVDYKYRPLPW